LENCWAVPSRSFHISVPRLEESKIVVVPPFADSISEGDVRWEKAVGDQVSIDETVAEVETDKVISQNNLKIVSKPL
jgi:2-oxoglutarate dehydrogenase E2 component (dihydrolipoamide succinyltransferase)